MSDATPGDRVALPCPACSPDVEQVHEVLSTGGQATVRCTACDHVHKRSLPEPETRDVTVVVSQDGESVSTSTSVPVDEELAVGEEFVVETDAAVLTARITSLETDRGRVEEATADDVGTIWSRGVGNVAVPVTVHPADGGREDTRSEELPVPGDHTFTVGETETFGDLEFSVESFLVRSDATGYDREQYDERGDAVAAKDVKRLYVRDESSTAWSAW